MSQSPVPHPIISSKLSSLRDSKSAGEYRRLLKEVTVLLGHQASVDFQLDPVTRQILHTIAILSITKSGLCMADGLLEIFPDASSHLLGFDRTANVNIPIESFLPVLPDSSSDIAIVAEPSLTDHTVKLVVDLLKQWGARRVIVICAVGALSAVNTLRSTYPDVALHVGAVSSEGDVCNCSQSLPCWCIGDATSRQFGTLLRAFTGGTSRSILPPPTMDQMPMEGLKGTSVAPFTVIKTIDPVNNNIKAHMQFITAMPEYNGKSLEQLRFEDYLLKRRGALPTITNLPNTTPAATDSETSTSPSEPPAVTGPFTGTHGPPFTVIKTIDPVNNNIKAHMQFITAMTEYNGKSLEQLRFEDYMFARGISVTQSPAIASTAVPSSSSTAISRPSNRAIIEAYKPPSLPQGVMPARIGTERFRATSESLRDAVELWCRDRDSAVRVYGPIEEWDTSQVTDMNGLFYRQTHFNDDISGWDVSRVVNMQSMFLGAANFNQSLDSWDVHNVTNFSYMFHGATKFNSSLGRWNVGEAVYLVGMFQGATAFNQPLGDWNTSKVRDTSYMFYGASAFNQPIGVWNTSNVIAMREMFREAVSFNQTVHSWNMQSVGNTTSMFQGAVAFNQSLEQWAMQNVLHMGGMFFGASSFNQPLQSWSVERVEDMAFMFCEAKAFNQSLDAWNVQCVTSMREMFRGSAVGDSIVRLTSEWATKYPNCDHTRMLNSGFDSENAAYPIVHCDTGDCERVIYVCDIRYGSDPRTCDLCAKRDQSEYFLCMQHNYVTCVDCSTCSG